MPLTIPGLKVIAAPMYCMTCGNTITQEPYYAVSDPDQDELVYIDRPSCLEEWGWSWPEGEDPGHIHYEDTYRAITQPGEDRAVI